MALTQDIWDTRVRKRSQTMTSFVSYADLYEHTQIDDELYKANLAHQIKDLVHVEPDAYEVLDLERIVDCVNEFRDILACDERHPVDMDHQMCPDLEYIKCEINFSHFYASEINHMMNVHHVLRSLIEN